MADRFKVDAGVGQRLVKVAAGVQRGGDRLDPLPVRFELQSVWQQFGPRARGIDCCGHSVGHGFGQLGAYRPQQRAALDRCLAAQQVKAVDAVGALVDRIEPVVAVKLFDVVFTRVAVAAMYLDCQAVGLHAPLRRPRLGDRCEEIEQTAGLAARRF